MKMCNGDFLTSYPMCKKLYQGMIRYCISELPLEACGLLSGPIGSASATTLWPLPNEAKSPVRFVLSAASVERMMKEMAAVGEEMTGIFHSHPTAPPFPSPIDIRYNPYPDLPYLIVALCSSPAEVGCFRMDKRRIEGLQIVLL
jgi:[CysO sulfur-carrier protein]-S-L-cysteine hydrolase